MAAWTSHSLITNATRAATSGANTRWTKRWRISSDRIAAIRDWSARCLAFRVARFPKRSRSLRAAVEFRGNQDVRLTIDRALQQAAVDQLKGKHGAVVILNPQNGDVLAMYSEPSYSLTEVDDEATWIRLEANERDKPLVSRALGAYYIPGSTFKTVTMIAAFLAGEQDTEFTCSGGGYYAAPGANVIFDDAGPAEVHGRIGIDHATKFPATSISRRWG